MINVKKNLMFLLLIFFVFILTSCGGSKERIDGLNDIMNKIDEEFIRQTEQYFYEDSEIHFELIDKKTTDKKKYEKIVKKVYGYDFDRAIIMIDKTYDKYYIAYLDFYQNCDKFPHNELRNDPLLYNVYHYSGTIINEVLYYCLSFPHFFKFDDTYRVEGNYEMYGLSIIQYIGSNEKSIVIPYIKYIESYSFANNKTLKSVVIPSSVQYIYANSFRNCEELEKVFIGSNVEIIGNYAFYNCKKLKFVVIPKSVNNMSRAAFNYGSIYCEHEYRPFGWNINFATGDAKVYWKGEWEYNSEGIPQPIQNTNE